jgi:hypothetical protein
VISWLFEFCCFHIQLVPLRIGRFIYAAESGDEEDEAARDGGGGGGGGGRLLTDTVMVGRGRRLSLDELISVGTGGGVGAGGGGGHTFEVKPELRHVGH